MDKTVDELDNEIIHKELVSLAKDGQAYAICPKCTLPLDMEELVSTVCKTCGQIDVSDLHWRSVSSQPDS